ncbi:MAG: hypothetical protein ABJA87_05315 [bacterium]
MHLTGVGQDQGPDAQGNLVTTATISFAGFPIGTTRASFTPSGPPTGGVLAFTGPIVFTPSGSTATVTATVAGSVDLATGTFQATSTSVTAAGVPLVVSGALTFRGTENLSTGAFTETITGRLCVNRR